MISKQEFHATDKIGPVDSKLELGLCYQFADSDITFIIKVLNFGHSFVLMTLWEIANKCSLVAETKNHHIATEIMVVDFF